MKLLGAFLLSYPLAGILKRVPDAKPYQKNLFTIGYVRGPKGNALSSETDIQSVSLFYLIGLFDLWSGIRTILISSVGAYMIAYHFQGPFMPWIGFVFVMGHMSVNHIYRQFANMPDKVDITGKLSSKLQKSGH